MRVTMTARVLRSPIGTRAGTFAKAEGETGGVGLGLSIVRRILEQHQGSVTITASPQGGCRVESSWPSSYQPDWLMSAGARCCGSDSPCLKSE